LNESATDLEEKEEEISPSNYSFHDSVSGTNNWYVVKISSNETIHIEEFYLRYELDWNDWEARKTGTFVMLGNLQGGEFHRSGSLAGWPDDFYIQIDIGPVNWSYKHLRPDLGGNEIFTLKMSLDLPAGTWYFVYAVFTDKGTHNMELWINTTSEANFSSTKGTDVFLYSREDFFGILNTGCHWGTLMIDGEIKFDIDGAFMGWIKPLGANGWEKLEYTDPEGNHKEMRQIDFRNRIVNRSGNLDSSAPIIGGSGKWTFKASMINCGLLSPNILLFGADIILP
jgi:hypothetical protein